MGFFNDLAYNVRGAIAKEMGLSNEPFHRRPYLISDPKKRLKELDWLLKEGGLSEMLEKARTEPEKEAFRQIMRESIEEYNGLRNKLGYPYFPIWEAPAEKNYKKSQVSNAIQASNYDEDAYCNQDAYEGYHNSKTASDEAGLYIEKQQVYNEILVQQAQWQQEKEAQELWLESERDRFKHNLECRRIEMEKELAMYDTQLKHTSFSYTQELQILQLQMENERLRAIIADIDT